MNKWEDFLAALQRKEEESKKNTVLWVLAIGFNPALRISLKSYFKPLNFSIIWEVMGIGIPASVESVLFTSGRLLTQMLVAGMGTSVIDGTVIS